MRHNLIRVEDEGMEKKRKVLGRVGFKEAKGAST
jgi:hypothetical protein